MQPNFRNVYNLQPQTWYHGHENHVINKHGPNLVKYMVHIIAIESKDTGNDINVNKGHLLCLWSL